MEQFSHDLTLALEETSRCYENRNQWGMRRRTRSTGNLPCAPQPTEDSSSSPADQLEMNTSQNSPQLSGGNNLILSDSDDRHTLAFAFRSRQPPLCGNFESDSFNENFSPARPNMRRKRKFKRIVGYDASLSSSNVTSSSMFPAIVRKRAYTHENIRANLFLCGKRKRSHRDRYMDFESYKQHSSSVPRQRDLFAPKSTSYLECKSRTRASSFTSSVPINRTLISKIEKISQHTDRGMKLCFQFSTPPVKHNDSVDGLPETVTSEHEPMCDVIDGTTQFGKVTISSSNIPLLPILVPDSTLPSTLPSTQKSSSIDSGKSIPTRTNKSKRSSKSRRVKHIKKKELMQLQLDERMVSANMSDLLSSSSLSSSDSEVVESDHEGDDELTDWPGNEGMVNFASKNDFKRASKPRLMKPSLPQIKQQDDIQDDDTLMSTDDVCIKKALDSERDCITVPLNCFAGLKYSPGSSEDLPLDKPCSSLPVTGVDFTSVTGDPSSSYTVGSAAHVSSNLFSVPDLSSDIREIRAGCRRIRDERPGFSIISPANELLSRFLQNDQQVLTLFNINVCEHEKLFELSKLYSLAMHVEGGCVTLTKTSNTTQSVRVDHTYLPKSFADFKRRCYGEEENLHFNNLSK